MQDLQVPEFSAYEEEAAFWDNVDTADIMEEDADWFRFETPTKRAVRVAVLPDTARELIRIAHGQGVSLETLVNVFLVERLQQCADAS